MTTPFPLSLSKKKIRTSLQLRFPSQMPFMNGWKGHAVTQAEVVGTRDTEGPHTMTYTNCFPLGGRDFHVRRDHPPSDHIRGSEEPDHGSSQTALLKRTGRSWGPSGQGPVGKNGTESRALVVRVAAVVSEMMAPGLCCFHPL